MYVCVYIYICINVYVYIYLFIPRCIQALSKDNAAERLKE